VARRVAETWISIDVETSGPTPATGSLLSLGACLVDRPEEGLELLLRPDPQAGWDEEAATVHRLDRATLFRDGLPPAEAAAALDAWLGRVVPGGSRAVFVGLNAAFDWMFVSDLVWRHLGRNPFGPSPLDIKATYLGRHWPAVGEWAATTRGRIRDRHPVGHPHTHQALDDAREQAALLRAILELPEA
jgi:DNA polymerase III epsilon subunit-like protein